MRSPRAWARVPLPPAAPAPGPRAEPAFLARVRPRPPRCSAPARGTAARDARGPESAETRPPPGRAPGCCRGPGTAALRIRNFNTISHAVILYPAFSQVSKLKRSDSV
ncbi:Protein Unc-13 A [Manis pentadactyla]|nr:Protein Unc-13 A [Manis pentadactyla]